MQKQQRPIFSFCSFILLGYFFLATAEKNHALFLRHWFIRLLFFFHFLNIIIVSEESKINKMWPIYGSRFRKCDPVDDLRLIIMQTKTTTTTTTTIKELVSHRILADEMKKTTLSTLYLIFNNTIQKNIKIEINLNREIILWLSHENLKIKRSKVKVRLFLITLNIKMIFIFKKICLPRGNDEIYL